MRDLQLRICTTKKLNIEHGTWKERFKKELSINYQLYLIILLPLAYIIIFHYIPMFGVQIAFKDFIAVEGIVGSPWVGLKYFVKFFESYEFWRVIRNTLEISFYSLIAGFPIPVLLALALNNVKNIYFKKCVQLVTYAPYFISTVVLVGILSQFLSTADYGIINNLIRTLGGNPVMFMANPENFSSVYVWSSIWQGAGWSAIIYIAALSSVDQELYEASTIDGASLLQRVIHIDIPCIMPTMVIMLILATGQIMNVGFEKVILMQNSLNMQRSEVISTFVYKIGLATSLPNYSYGAAVGLFNSIINFIMLVLVNSFSKRVSETSLW